MVDYPGAEFAGQTTLTPEMLEAEGLGPRFKIVIDGKEYGYASQVYQIGKKGRAVTVYIPNGSELVPRTYLNNYRGVWEYLPGYYPGEDQRPMLILSSSAKGAFDAPPGVQEALASVHGMMGVHNKLSKVDPFLVLFGTTQEKSNGSEVVAEALKDQALSNPLLGIPPLEEKELPVLDKAKHVVLPEHPNLLKLTPEQSPDFSNRIAAWKENSTLYGGDVEYERFRSNDGTLEYVFCRDQAKRAWIGSIVPAQVVRSGKGRQ
jgi:hypothetical protein